MLVHARAHFTPSVLQSDITTLFDTLHSSSSSIINISADPLSAILPSVHTQHCRTLQAIHALTQEYGP